MSGESIVDRRGPSRAVLPVLLLILLLAPAAAASSSALRSTIRGMDAVSTSAARGSIGRAGPPEGKGLDNAIARVSANLERHPNRGLENALSRLERNRERQEAHRAERTAPGAGEKASERGASRPKDARGRGRATAPGQNKPGKG